MRYYINDLTQQVVATCQEHSDVHMLYNSREEATSASMQPGYLANLLIQSQKPGATVKASHSQMLRIAEYLELLTHIHGELDAAVWDADSCQNIANYMEARGLRVQDVNDEPEEE